MAAPAVAKVLGAGLGAGGVGTIVKAGTDLQREDIRERQKTTRAKYQKQVEFERFEKKLMEKYLTVGQTSMQETRKSINDLSLPFYEVSWAKKGKTHKFRLSPLVFMMLMGLHGPAYYARDYGTLMSEYYRKLSAWQIANPPPKVGPPAPIPGNITAIKTAADAKRDKMHQSFDKHYSDPWIEIVNNKGDWFKDAAQQIIYPPPPDPAVEHKVVTPGSSQWFEDRGVQERIPYTNAFERIADLFGGSK